MVWIAGPLSGLIVQPVVGILSDSSRSRWGRRRPFMIGGVLLVAVCLLLLGWTAEIVSMFVTEPDRVSMGAYLPIERLGTDWTIRNPRIASLWLFSASTRSILPSTWVMLSSSISIQVELSPVQSNHHAGV